MPTEVKKNGKYNDEAQLTAFEEQVAKSLNKHIELMLADSWYITLEFTTVEGEAMECTVKQEYRKAEINVDTAQLEGQPEYIDHYIRHELLHILVWNFFDIAGTLAYKNAADALVKLEESVIDRLEHMPLWNKLYDKET